MFELTIRHLLLDDAPRLSSMLRAQRSSHVRFFVPFSFDEKTISSILATLSDDVFMGIEWEGHLAGFFMLRGWDQGYQVPSFGVMIDESYSRLGLTWLSLKIAKSICKLRGTSRIMLKVDPENVKAKALFEAANFVDTGLVSKTGNLIYHFDLDAQSAEM